MVYPSVHVLRVNIMFFFPPSQLSDFIPWHLEVHLHGEAMFCWSRNVYCKPGIREKLLPLLLSETLDLVLKLGGGLPSTSNFPVLHELVASSAQGLVTGIAGVDTCGGDFRQGDQLQVRTNIGVCQCHIMLV